MPDKGHMETEALLRALEKRIAAEYRKANREITRKVNAYMSEFKRKDKEWREKLENGDITEAEYKAWQTGQVMIGKRWEEMRHTIAQDYANTNDIARQMVTNEMPDVYALNHNYATFEVEKGGKVDTSYTLYDRPTVERLIRDDPKLLPDPRPGSPLAQKLAKHKELRWEEQHVQSVVLQSILQGESLEQTAKRFTQLTEMNYRQSVRYARTATTGAQNAGRVDGYKRAEKLGVKIVKQWVAALDNRTRHEHRLLDGQTQPLDKPFICEGVEIEYPGKVIEQTYLLYNCRCTVIAKVKGVDFNVSDKTQRDDKIGDMSYEEWKGEHKTVPKPPEGKAVEVKVDKPAKSEYKEKPIKPKEAEIGKTFEYKTNMGNTKTVQMQYTPTQETLDKYETIGIRAVPPEQEGEYGIGDILPESYDWDFENDRSTYYTTGETLGGSSALMVKIENGETLEEAIQKALEGTYEYSGKDIFIVGGDFVNMGDDTNEVIIKNATAIGKIGIYREDEKIKELSSLKIKIAEPEKTTVKELKENIEAVKTTDLKEKVETVSAKSKAELFAEFKAEMEAKYNNVPKWAVFQEMSPEEKKKWNSLK